MSKHVGFLVGLLSLSGMLACVPAEPPKTQLEIREFQTRQYDIQDIKMALKAVLNVLQDEGYIVKQADSDLGFLTATKETPIGGAGAFLGAFSKYDPTYDSNRAIECTANVSIFNSQTRVRVNFLDKVFNNKGGVSRVRQIDDPAFYQQFFSKVDKGMFLEKQKI